MSRRNGLFKFIAGIGLGVGAYASSTKDWWRIT